MRVRVLIVDDDEVYLDGMKELLEEAGYDVSLASSFDAGKFELREHAPDLLIIDVRLGAFNGLQLISTGQLRIPAIVVTGFDDTVLRADAGGFGASYMVKPIMPSALLALIEERLASRDQDLQSADRLADSSPDLDEHTEMSGAQALHEPE